MARTKKFNPDRDVTVWVGPYRPYDLAKEIIVTFLAVAVIAVVLAAVFGSPDEKSVTLKSWSTADQVDFATTAITELDGSSATAQYGPPYNNVADVSQKVGPISVESALGVHIPVNPAQDFVLGPLSTVTGHPDLTAALTQFKAAISRNSQPQAVLTPPCSTMPASSAPTTPSRCCSWPTGATSPPSVMPTTSPASSGG